MFLTAEPQKEVARVLGLTKQLPKQTLPKVSTTPSIKSLSEIEPALDVPQGSSWPPRPNPTTGKAILGWRDADQ